MNGFMSIYIDGNYYTGGGSFGEWSDFSANLFGEGNHTVRFELSTSLYSGMPQTGLYYLISDFKAIKGEVCTVSLDTNGGVWQYDYEGDVVQVIADFAGVYLYEPVPASQYLEFAGWWTTLDDSGEEVTADTPAYDGMTIYAHWQGIESEPEWYYEMVEDDDGNEIGVVITGYSVNFAGALEIPAMIDGLPVIAISGWAFEGLCITSVTIPASVTTIENYAFGYCRWLETVAFQGDEDAIEMNKYIAFCNTPWLPHPDNDEYEDAQLIEGASGDVVGTLLGATIADNDCIWRYGDAERTVWYKWVAPFTGNVIFAATADNGRSDLLYLVATHGYDKDEEKWDDCGYDGGKTVAFGVKEGETYYVSLATWNYVVSGFTLSWQRLLPPDNDNFADATMISGTSGSVTGTNLGANVEDGEPLPLEEEGHWTFDSTATVWWRWTAPKSGCYTFTTQGSDFDTVLGVYTGNAVDTLVKVAANDEGLDDGISAVAFDATMDTIYYIAVGGYGSHMGNIVLRWSEAVDEGEVVIEAGENIVEDNGDGAYVITPPAGGELTAADVDTVTVKTRLNGEWVSTTTGYDIVFDGGVITVSLKKADVNIAVGTALKVPGDKSGFLVDPGMVTVEGEPDLSVGETRGALPVNAVPGLWYQASWGPRLDAMTEGVKVQATSETLYLGVVRQNGTSGFYGIKVMDK